MQLVNERGIACPPSKETRFFRK